jgi:hypothetical protein
MYYWLAKNEWMRFQNIIEEVYDKNKISIVYLCAIY